MRRRDTHISGAWLIPHLKGTHTSMPRFPFDPDLEPDDDETLDIAPPPDPLAPMAIIPAELRASAEHLSPSGVRYMVDSYYDAQEQRIRAASQVREALKAGEEPNRLLEWVFDSHKRMESNIKTAMLAYARSTVPGQWLLSITGIGPVLAAGLLAHIDITRAPSPSHIWSYAGLNPTVVWGKGQKRPWNARLKVLSWKIGESFVKSANRPSSFYGPFYQERKVLEQTRNDQLLFREQAEHILQTKRIGTDTDAYKAYSVGKLPPAHIQARAKRYAVKIFLVHLHTVLYETHYQSPAPAPWIIAHGGHVDQIPVPGWRDGGLVSAEPERRRA